MPWDLQDLYHQCTVRVDIRGGQRYGTGFFVAPGKVVTCAHVVGEDGAPEDLTLYYQGKLYPAAVLTLIPPTLPHVESYPDIALLTTTFTEHPCVYFDQNFKPTPELALYTFGYTRRTAYGESITASCSGIHNDGPGQTLIGFSNGQVIAGLSGAPLLNQATLAVCGMVNRTRGDENALGGLAVPVAELIAHLARGSNGNLEDIAAANARWHREHTAWVALAQPASVPPSVPRKLFVVPRANNLFFAGRDALLNDISTDLLSLGRVGIAGLGGVGKTQIAVQYAYRHRTDYANVFWADASDVDSLTKSYAAIATALELPQSILSDERQAIAAVLRWFESNDGWLLVLDGVDTPKVTAPFVPSAGAGHILATTRRPDLAAINIARTIPVSPFTIDEAVSFLLNRTARSGEIERSRARLIVLLLGCLPLALEQAGAHILASGSGLDEYAEALQRGGLTVLERGRAEAGNYRQSVGTTWRYAFEAIDDAPVARELLLLSAFMNSDDIPLDLIPYLRRAVSPETGRLLDAEDPVVALGLILEPLTSYSLISRDLTRKSFSIHRLVQEAIRRRLASGECATWTARAAALIEAAQPDVRFGTWELHSKLIPHVQTLARFLTQYAVETDAAASMLDTAGSYLFSRGRFREALDLFQQSLRMRETLHGAFGTSTAQSLTHVANVQRDLGKYEIALPLYRRALAIREKQLPKSAETASTLTNMAGLLAIVGKFVESERLYRRALAIEKSRRPSNEARIVEITDNLALLLDQRGRFGEALRFHQQALTIRRRREDVEPLEFAQSLNNLGYHYVERDLYARAAPHFRAALAIFEKFLEPTHPDRFMCRYNNALILDFEQKDADAEIAYLGVIETMRAELGPDHVDLGLAENSLGTLYARLGRRQEARAAFERALRIVRKSLDPRHPIESMVARNLKDLDSKKPPELPRRKSAQGIRGRKASRRGTTTRKAAAKKKTGAKKTVAKKSTGRKSRKAARGLRGSPKKR